MSALRRLAAAVVPYRKYLMLATAAAIGAAALDGFVLTLLIPFLRVLFGTVVVGSEGPTAIERFVDWITGGVLAGADPSQSLRNVAIVILVGVVVKNAAQFAADYLGRIVQEGVTRDLRTAVFDRLQAADIGAVTGVRRGEALATVTADTEHVSGVVGSAAITGVRQAGLLVVYVAVLAALAFRLMLVTLLLAPIVVIVLRPVLRKVRQSSREAFAERGELGALLVETLDGARVVRAHGGETQESGRFRDAPISPMGAPAGPVSDDAPATMSRIVLACASRHPQTLAGLRLARPRRRLRT